MKKWGTFHNMCKIMNILKISQFIDKIVIQLKYLFLQDQEAVKSWIKHNSSILVCAYLFHPYQEFSNLLQAHRFPFTNFVFFHLSVSL